MRSKTIILLIGILFCLSNIAPAKADPSVTWKCFDVLDAKTKKHLQNFERFFDSLYRLPDSYNLASEDEKSKMVGKWIKKLQSNDRDKAVEAAAYLGIVKAKNAVKPLHEAIKTRNSNRVRWVCIRSLGQIGNQSSIPVLTSYLNSSNSNTRIYSKVGLAEITGMSSDDDKKNVENRQTGKILQLCSSTECKIGEAEHAASFARSSFSKDKLDFSLPDIYGRIVDSQDYANIPVLIMSGSCWCGGCQQDAEPLRKIAADYAKKGLAVIRTVAGDNELAALDFQKHYRLPFVQLLDTNRSFEKLHNKDGWTFLMLADRNGKIVYKINSPHEKDWFNIRGILNKMLSTTISNKTIIRDGISYMPATVQRSGEMEKQRTCERFPSIACGPNGQIYVVFTTNRNGSNDVFIRVFDGDKWSEDMPIAATADDEYDAMVLVDKEGHIWVCWTSNTGGRQYDIFAVSFTNALQPGTPVKLTYSDDDAMHPRMVCDKNGRVWITYYKWHKMGEYSRDKEVYIRKYEHGKWSDEVQVSPTDVPRYEDHSDPAIIAYGNGVIVAWSWDFHPPNKGYSNQAKTPTIFMRPIAGNMNLAKISCVSGKNIDATPSLIISNDRQIWCAWDSLGRGNRKSLCVSNVRAGRNNPTTGISFMSTSMANVCTPSFAVGSGDLLTLFWSETEDNANWLLKRCDYNKQNKKWSEPQIVEDKGNPRYCSARYDSANNLYLAYSVETDNGRKIIVKNTGKSPLKFTGKESDFNSWDYANNANAITRLRQVIDEKYSYRDLRRIDWDKMFRIFTPKLNRAKTPEQFAQITSKMLSAARDMHIWIKVDGKGMPGGFKRKARSNYNINLLAKRIPQWKNRNKVISSGRFDNDVGYILIKNWLRNDNQLHNAAFQALRELSDTKALIIDVRPNGGGAEPLARDFAGCFIGKPVVYAKHVYIDRRQNSNGWGEIRERILKPNSNMPRYQGQVVVLMGQRNMSSCEAFLLMMKQVPGCVLMGEKSYGSSGNPKPHDLGNGVVVYLPSWKALRADGTCFEGEGIKPDILVRSTGSDLNRNDRVIEKALMYIRKKLSRTSHGNSTDN